ncbi:uncharacterized protein LOC142972800 [Anticarsia gemmatalis]|uniref:uncharacterized protein LOC142972800 n=1 Tax=Anticarsia gemmatalis TaxID=129554 RepID=UPI003F75F1A7
MVLPDVDDALRETEEVLRQCFTEYELDEVFLSFNGGKDCTVLLDITINILKEIHERDDIASELKVMYIRTGETFNAIETFVDEIEEHYGIKMMVTEGDLKTALEQLLKKDERIKACLMGTRRTDPYCEHLNFMQSTDAGWPKIMRVSPLLNWSYHQIWSYILQENVPYCLLYERGYTSIGSVHNTRPNPTLAFVDPNGRTTYLPAWQLKDGSLERAGRGVAPIQVNGHKDNGQRENDNGHIQNGHIESEKGHIQNGHKENGHD